MELIGLRTEQLRNFFNICRLFFVFSFILVVVVSCYFIADAYNKWCLTPIILSVNPNPTLITEEPFPAVTICNLNLAQRSKVKNLSKDSVQYALLQSVCNQEANMTLPKTAQAWNIVEEFLLNVSQPCSNLMISCRFGDITYNCCQIFRPIITDCGLCYVFNMAHPKFLYKPNVTILNISYSDGSIPIDWDPERGYPKYLPPKYYPRTAAGTGEFLGLRVILNLDIDEYYCSSSNGIGFKIFLHSPVEWPCVKDVGLFIAAGKENKLRIRASKLETDFVLRSIRRTIRKCSFNDEETLTYFASYTKRNCELECLARVIMTNCGCINYFMPKMTKFGRICGKEDMICVQKHRRMSLLSNEHFQSCSDLCSLSCCDLTFDADLYSIPLSAEGFSVEEKLIRNMSTAFLSRNIAILNFYFKENDYRSRIQQEFTGVTDFLSSTGGLMGLFVGFSFISLAEFVYFACMRPFYNIRRQFRLRNSEKKSDSKVIKRKQAIRNLHRRYKNQFKQNNSASISPMVHRYVNGTFFN